ncbi:MAG TPA: hypothetical protein ENG70_03060 [Candidatus Cloacimonetes bacterium]|nr:hypothetical protein [Candidatus Cloacimonadota bacterium]HEX37823.1 hypothetical protein [Candidatus Cloacimonadota bacterium]
MLHIHLRFYEELNVFIPQEFRKKRFSHTLKVQTSVKDLVESFNVPHTQVDMILVNQKQVDFSHIIKDHDDISVFPYFHRFKIEAISKISHPKPEIIRFIADNHLGNLARDLRMLGLDTLHNERFIHHELVEQANSQERILLTKDRNILKRNDLNFGYYVYANQDADQLAEVVLQFDLADKLSPLSRCLRCNAILEKIDKDKVLDRLPQRVKHTHNSFTYCPHCDKVFWKGTHIDRMTEKLDTILETMKVPNKNKPHRTQSTLRTIGGINAKRK